MKRKGFFVIFNTLIFIILCVNVKGQKFPATTRATSPRLAAYASSGIVIRPNASIPASWYTDNLAGFCRPEWKLEKTTGIPLRLRLGSLEYVNRLEGKR